MRKLLQTGSYVYVTLLKTKEQQQFFKVAHRYKVYCDYEDLIYLTGDGGHVTDFELSQITPA